MGRSTKESGIACHRNKRSSSNKKLSISDDSIRLKFKFIRIVHTSSKFKTIALTLPTVLTTSTVEAIPGIF